MDAAGTSAPAASGDAHIALVAGRMAMPDRVGHHDYLGGCALLAALLAQSPGVRCTVVPDGWPPDEAVLEQARALVCYSGGIDKQPLLVSAERRERVQALADRGVGLVMIHQAVRCRVERAALLSSWVGGAHVPGESARGHWRTHHADFPAHPVARGVAPWTIRDGWLNQIRFVDGMAGVTPLVWSGPQHRGASAGGAADVVAWAYERPGGGRAFCFTGVDAHSAWAVDGLRQLVVNGILWAAGLPVPDAGAPAAIDAAQLRGYLTPRGSGGLGRLLQRALRLAR
jgi:Trehalose utilisation